MKSSLITFLAIPSIVSATTSEQRLESVTGLIGTTAMTLTVGKNQTPTEELEGDGEFEKSVEGLFLYEEQASFIKAVSTREELQEELNRIRGMAKKDGSNIEYIGFLALETLRVNSDLLSSDEQLALIAAHDYGTEKQIQGEGAEEGYRSLFNFLMNGIPVNPAGQRILDKKMEEIAPTLESENPLQKDRPEKERTIFRTQPELPKVLKVCVISAGVLLLAASVFAITRTKRY